MARPLDNLGSYELLRPLGAGGMAETFVAIRRGPAGFEQRVCLKRILPGCAADPMFVELFLDEARLLARLQCRNIVHVYDFGEADGTYYMSLELVDGVDLEGLLKALRARNARMSPSVALYVIGEVLSALSYAHTLEIDGEPQHIVHRDISPSNILVSKNGEVKLTDFGIAKARGRSHRTQTGHTKGKVAYMSPEQMRAEPLDGRSDLFAVGVVLFELLTGTHPFDANTDFALQLNIMQGKRPPLRELLPDVPAPIAQLVDALLATDAAQRPATAADAIALIPAIEAPFTLQRELQQLLAARETTSGASSSAGSAPRSTPHSSHASDLGFSATQRAPLGGPEARVEPRASMQSGAGAAPATAQQTAASQPSVASLRRPAVWIAAAVLLVLALGYTLSRPRTPSAQPESPSLPARETAPAPLPAAPAAQHPSSVRIGRAPEASPPSGREAPEATPPAPAAAPTSADEARASQREKRRAERHKNRQHESTAKAQDEAREAESKPSTFVSATRPASNPPAADEDSARNSETGARAPAEARVVIQAPRGTEGNKAPLERKAYVTPSGRVVLPAPPLP